MLLSDIFYCVILTITVTATCVGAEKQEKEVSQKKYYRIRKRDATMLIDNFPIEAVYQKPKVIYRKVSGISKHRYGPKRPKYGPPRPKYRPSKVTRKPGKGFGGKNASPKYRPTTHKKRPVKSKYAIPKRSKPGYGPPHQAPAFPASGGFAEPPANFEDFKKPPNGEPPIDSYRAPLKTTWHDFPIQQTNNPTKYFENEDVADVNSEYHSWKNLQHEQNVDNAKSHSKKHFEFTKPDSEREPYVTLVTPDDNEQNLNSYSDIYTYREKQKQKKEKAKMPFYPENLKFVNKPWKPQKPDLDEEIIVGGQYAEPPARYIPKYKSDPSAADDDLSYHQSYIDSEIPSSATTSPYVNYKNSNVAFSPQNLNDAFSIVD